MNTRGPFNRQSATKDTLRRITCLPLSLASCNPDNSRSERPNSDMSALLAEAAAAGFLAGVAAGGGA